MLKIVVLGNGNVATQLCQSFEKNSEVLLLQNYNRSGMTILNCNVPTTSSISEIIKAEIYILAFNDEALNELEKFRDLDGLVVHTSGATDINVLKKFKNYGVFYPLQSFKKHIPINLSKVPIAYEANTKFNEKLLYKLAGTFTNPKNIHHLNSNQRLAVHTAAVFANNFSNLMYTMALELCNDFEIDFSILKPLIFETFAKLEAYLPNQIQTGPAIRHDNTTINKHLTLLKTEEQKIIYKTLTKAIQNYYEKKL